MELVLAYLVSYSRLNLPDTVVSVVLLQQNYMANLPPLQKLRVVRERIA